MAEETETSEKKINVSLVAEAHRNLGILTKAWSMTQGEVLSYLLVNYDVSAAVDRLR